MPWVNSLKIAGSMIKIGIYRDSSGLLAVRSITEENVRKDEENRGSLFYRSRDLLETMEISTDHPGPGRLLLQLMEYDGPNIGNCGIEGEIERIVYDAIKLGIKHCALFPPDTAITIPDDPPSPR